MYLWGLTSFLATWYLLNLCGFVFAKGFSCVSYSTPSLLTNLIIVDTFSRTQNAPMERSSTHIILLYTILVVPASFSRHYSGCAPCDSGIVSVPHGTQCHGFLLRSLPCLHGRLGGDFELDGCRSHRSEFGQIAVSRPDSEGYQHESSYCGCERMPCPAPPPLPTRWIRPAQCRAGGSRHGHFTRLCDSRYYGIPR